MWREWAKSFCFNKPLIDAFSGVIDINSIKTGQSSRMMIIFIIYIDELHSLLRILLRKHTPPPYPPPPYPLPP